MPQRLSRNSLETGCRNRRYKCRKCNKSFEVYGRYKLPRKANICPECRGDPVVNAEYKKALDEDVKWGNIRMIHNTNIEEGIPC